MWRFNGHGILILRVALVISLLTLAMLGWIVWHQVSDDIVTGVTYDAPSYIPNEAGPFCAGDVLTYEVTSSRDRIAPLDVFGNWCNATTAFCMADETLEYHIAIFDLRQPVTRTRSIVIPDNPRLTPGDWLYVHQIAVANSSNWQTYVVPFTIAEDCAQ